MNSAIYNAKFVKELKETYPYISPSTIGKIYVIEKDLNQNATRTELQRLSNSMTAQEKANAIATTAAAKKKSNNEHAAQLEKLFIISDALPTSTARQRKNAYSNAKGDVDKAIAMLKERLGIELTNNEHELIYNPFPGNSKAVRTLKARFAKLKGSSPASPVSISSAAPVSATAAISAGKPYTLSTGSITQTAAASYPQSRVPLHPGLPSVVARLGAQQTAFRNATRGAQNAVESQKQLAQGNKLLESSMASTIAATAGLPKEMRTTTNAFTSASNRLAATEKVVGSSSAWTSSNKGAAGEEEELIRRLQEEANLNLALKFPRKKGGKRSRRLKSKRSKKTRRHVRRV